MSVAVGTSMNHEKYMVYFKRARADHNRLRGRRYASQSAMRLRALWTGCQRAEYLRNRSRHVSTDV